MINNSLVIGVAGGSGSGKSTFAKRICDYFGDKAVLISCDNYYLAHDDIPLEKRAKLNYDIPEAFEFDLMLKQMNVLRSGRAIDCPVYDFTVHTRSDKTIKIEPKPVIVIDGILALYDDNLRDIMDVKVFVETDADEKILRRVRRDVGERGRSIESIIEQYLTTVKPMHYRYIEPTKQYADVIINGGFNDVAFDLFKTKIDSFLSDEEKASKAL